MLDQLIIVHNKQNEDRSARTGDEPALKYSWRNASLYLVNVLLINRDQRA